MTNWISVTSFTKGVNQWLAKCPLKTNGRLANDWLTSLVKEATGGHTIGDQVFTLTILLKIVHFDENTWKIWIDFEQMTWDPFY